MIKDVLGWSPYSQLKDYPPLWSREEISCRYSPGFREAGVFRYGNWPEKPYPIFKYNPLQQKLLAEVSSFYRGKSCMMVDVGGGNGASFVEGAGKLSERGISALEVLLLDIQDTGFSDARKFYHENARSVKLVTSRVDISERIPGKVIKTADALNCDSMLHFIPKEKLDTAITNINLMMKSGSPAFFHICSIYNPASVGVGGNWKALEIVHKLTNNGESEEVISFFNPQMISTMSFFTQNSLIRLFGENGFEIEEVAGSGSRNGLGLNYPDHYNLLLRKK